MESGVFTEWHFIFIVLGLIGGMLVLFGREETGKKRNILLFLGFFFVVSYLTAILAFSSSARDTIIGLSTIAVAVSAVIALRHNTQLKKDAVARENRDRIERILNEIIQWSNDLFTEISDVNTLTGSREERYNSIAVKLVGINNKGRYIYELTREVFGKSDLPRLLRSLGKTSAITSSSLKYIIGMGFTQLLTSGETRQDEIAEIINNMNIALEKDRKTTEQCKPSTKEVDAIVRGFENDIRLCTMDISALCAQLKASLLNM